MPPLRLLSLFADQRDLGPMLPNCGLLLAMHTVSHPTVVDLFAGAGGIAEGFRQEGFESIAASDIDPDACASFARNFPDAVVVHGDLRSPLTKAKLLEAGGRADVVVGGRHVRLSRRCETTRG